MKKVVSAFVGLLVVIILTPFVFSKISNSKIDEEVLNLKQNEQVEIKELKSDSSYLTSKRHFVVTITDKSFPHSQEYRNLSELLKKVVVNVDVEFKNLPITDVKSKIVLKAFDLKNISTREQKDINKSVLDKVVAHLITNDFKHFNVKLDDYSFKVDDNNQLKISGNSGKFYIKDTLKNVDFVVKNFLLKDNGTKVELNNVHYFADARSRFNQKDTLSVAKFDMTKRSYYDNKIIGHITLNNIKFSLNRKVVNGIISGVEEISVGKILVKNGGMTVFDGSIHNKMELGNVSEKIINKLVNYQTNYKNNDKALKQDIEELLNGGITWKDEFNLNNAKVMMFNLGDDSLVANLVLDKDIAKKAGGVEALFNRINYNNDFTGISLDANVKLSSDTMKIINTYIDPNKLSNLNVKIDNNGAGSIKIEFKNNKLVVNGKELPLF